MTKAAFLDVDGTLTTGKSSWEKVHLHFNLEKEMEANSRRYFSGEINYDQWAALDVGLWKGRHIEEIYEAVNPPELIDGAVEGVNLLKQEGYEVILLSGGINIMVDEVKNLVGAKYAHSNQIGHTEGILDGSVGVTVGLKSKVLEELKQEGYDLSNSIAIGDNFNDIDMFEMVGYSVALNPKNQKLTEVADRVIHSDNFYEAINTIVKEKSNSQINQ